MKENINYLGMVNLLRSLLQKNHQTMEGGNNQ